MECFGQYVFQFRAVYCPASALISSISSCIRLCFCYASPGRAGPNFSGFVRAGPRNFRKRPTLQHPTSPIPKKCKHLAKNAKWPKCKQKNAFAFLALPCIPGSFRTFGLTRNDGGTSSRGKCSAVLEEGDLWGRNALISRLCPEAGTGPGGFMRNLGNAGYSSAIWHRTSPPQQNFAVFFLPAAADQLQHFLMEFKSERCSNNDRYATL